MPSSVTTLNLCRQEWIDCLARLRSARGQILRNAESFHEAASILEHVGQCLTGEIRRGLGQYESELIDLAELAGDEAREAALRLMPIVRSARNMAVHEGAWARHLSSRLVDLFLILEEAIMTNLTTVGDIMVQSPVTAEPWQPVSTARRALLANSFSALPILHEGTWHLLTDHAVVGYLRQASSPTKRKELLARKISDAVTGGALSLVRASLCETTTPIQQLADNGCDKPMLVVDKSTESPWLVGIITPFDLLGL